MSYKAKVLIEILASILIPSFSHASWTTRIRRPRQKKTGRVSRLEEKRNKPKASKSAFAAKPPILKRHRSRFKRLFQRFRYLSVDLVQPGAFVLRCRGLPVGNLNLWENQMLPCLPFRPLYLLQCSFPEAVFSDEINNRQTFR